MRTADATELLTERRLSATLDFSEVGAELLVLNGGAHAEELVVEMIVDVGERRFRRAAYCVDSGTSLQLVFPLYADESPADVSLRILGGVREMVLAEPVVRRRRKPALVARSLAGMAVAACCVLALGGRLEPMTELPTVEPVPAAASAPLVSPKIALNRVDRLPALLARTRTIAHVSVVPPAVRERVRPPVDVALAPHAPAARIVHTRPVPMPKMTDLRVPAIATSGQPVNVVFRAVADTVKIVASIGPTVVSRTIVAHRHSGVVAIRPPAAGHDSRVMMVRAYAKNGNRTSSMQAMVVIVP
jgi:hypothetical protein